MTNQTATTNETIEILDRDESCDGHVFYTISVGMYHKEEMVKFFQGQANGCTCKGKSKFNECVHQSRLATVEAEDQSH